MVRRKWAILGAAAGSAVVGWMLFHPELRPDPGSVSSEVLAELAKTGFAPTRGIRAAKFETSHSQADWTELGREEGEEACA
jgi:hypothetical protein